MEKVVLPQLVEEGVIKFYIRYVDDTLVMIKEEDVDKVLQKFNSFDKNLKFTVDKFEDGIIHFLDILIHGDGSTDIYTKPTNTGQYSNFDSYVPWRYKTSWAYALCIRAMKLCSTASLKAKQISRIKKLLSWNGFPKYVRNKLIKKYQSNYELSKNRPREDKKEDIESIYMKIPYMGPEGDKLVKTLKRKLRYNVSRKLSVRVVYTTTKISDLCSVKDKIPEQQKNNIIYNINCPGCGEDYIGKTDCCFGTRMHQQGNKPDQPMYLHLQECGDFNDITSLNVLPDVDKKKRVSIDKSAHISEAVKNNSKIIKSSRDWLELCYLESFMIKKHKSKINDGIKAARELQLF